MLSFHFVKIDFRKFFDSQNLFFDLGFSKFVESILGPHPNIAHIYGSENRVSVAEHNFSLGRPKVSARA